MMYRTLELLGMGDGWNFWAGDVLFQTAFGLMMHAIGV